MVFVCVVMLPENRFQTQVQLLTAEKSVRVGKESQEGGHLGKRWTNFSKTEGFKGEVTGKGRGAKCRRSRCPGG